MTSTPIGPIGEEALTKLIADLRAVARTQEYLEDEEVIDKAADALQSLSRRAQGGEGWRVKALEWLDWPDKSGDCRAVTPFGVFYITSAGTGWAYGMEGTTAWAETVESAKAAAQADYSQRITSAIEPTERTS